ncbi:MAG: TIGR03435 family protein [Acidobacteriota bacterium]|nr:TIGR03435 family protein [Acidobacteriota bacterium]MDE3264220.1 TIGR03435 family protein [Acidobacteriota bacterium]
MNWRLVIGALASLITVSSLACGGKAESGDDGEDDAPTSVDLSWAAPNPDAPVPGDRARVLVIEETLNAPADGDPDWAALKGKATVLEFWATWCAPCVDVIPHLNELAGALPADDIRFVSITDEAEEVVTPFLESTPISGLVGLDLDRSVFRDYGVLAIPTTFLVDREGVIQGVTHARHLSREHLLDLIAGRRPDVPEIEDIDGMLELKALDELTARVDGGHVVVRGSRGELLMLFAPTEKAEYAMSRSPDEVRMVAADPALILRVAYGVRPGRFVMEAELPDQKYDVAVMTGGRPELVEPMFRQIVSAGLGIEAAWEERVVDAYVIVQKGEPKLKPLPDSARYGYSASPDSLGATDLDGLADQVARLLERPTLNETGITGRYEILLKFDAPEPEAIFRAIEDILGLAVVEERRPIEMLVVGERAAGEPG